MVAGFDDRVLRFVVAHRIGVVTRGARLVMSIGSSRAVLAVAALATVAYLAKTRRWRLGGALFLAFVGATVITGVLKVAIGRPRPPAAVALVHLSGASMPSTHGARTAAVATAVLFCLDWVGGRARRVAGLLLALGVIAVGVVMVYLGVHWPIDVMAGWMVGAVVGAGVPPVWTAWRSLGGSPTRVMSHIQNRRGYTPSQIGTPEG